MRLGSAFKKPARKVIRKARYAAGSKEIDAAGIRKLIDAAGVPLKAMILLGISARRTRVHHEVRQALGAGEAESGADGKDTAAVKIDAVRLEFCKLLDALDMKRPGLGFYALRHTFRTVADRSKDQPAVDHLMGHARDDMASLYRERIDHDRLEAVVKVVHDWVWPAPTDTLSIGA